MVICNIVYNEEQLNDTDLLRIRKYGNYPSINTTQDISQINTGVPTLFYGLRNAQTHLGDSVSRSNTKVNDSYYWTYADSEVQFENWTEKFIEQCVKDWFKYTDNGIDVVFNAFFVGDFVDHLKPWPLIHRGAFEIYIADWRDGDIIIHSIKNDTLEYIGVKPEDFMNEICELLEYRFLSIDSSTFDLTGNKNLPIFLDDVLFVNSDTWIGIDEIIDYFSFIEIDRKKVITYYLKQSAFLREKFNLYLK